MKACHNIAILSLKVYGELENEWAAQVILLYKHHVQHQGSALKQFNVAIKCVPQ